jgi:hypothetical protein
MILVIDVPLCEPRQLESMDPLSLVALSIAGVLLLLPLAAACIRARKNRSVHYLIDSTSDFSLSSSAIINKMEKIVQERESKAFAPIVIVPQTRSNQAVAWIDKFASDLKAIMEWCPRMLANISTAIELADPSIERAYARLYRQLNVARELAAVSEAEEEEMERKITSHADNTSIWDSWTDKARECDHDWLLDNALQDIRRYEECAGDLSAALKIHRRKNFLIAESLFRIERIMRRLSVLKLLLRALPGSAKQESLQYYRLLQSVTGLLKQSLQRTDCAEVETWLSALESRTLMAFIRIAKGEAPLLTQDAAVRLQCEISKLVTEIQLQLSEETTLRAQWQTMAQNASADNRQFVLTVASDRMNQCASVVSSVQRTLEVLAVTANRVTQAS